MKKLIALLLATVMVAGLFAGCGEDSAKPTTEPTEVYEDFAQVDWD